ncbi:MAG TPA: SUMF1/EgtB/PvdO family nonheme iron enzyme [Chthoniobacteraceae bacterium]|jgi:formylglycine-generating enzyme required for sulfatase activity|nr:SUMF1/EgtB/PvdO family nonheme iron enzyme [Chthoniobacteraceae bacterium]
MKTVTNTISPQTVFSLTGSREWPASVGNKSTSLHIRGKFYALAVLIALGLTSVPASADNFGTGANTFTIDFVTIGNPGNGADLGAGGGVYSSQHGAVAYTFRMGVYEISQADILKATASGLQHVTSGPWTGNQPATSIAWSEAAAFVNWLNVSTGHAPAYNLTYTGSWTPALWSPAQAWQVGGDNLFRNKDAYYFLPSDDEWIKAAYHKNDGATANYWDFPTASNTAPDGLDFAGDPNFDAVFDQGYDPNGPFDIANAGSRASAYGTFGQGGNVYEWAETQTGGTNNAALSGREFYGGFWAGYGMSSDSTPGDYNYLDDASFLGFRVAGVPEPSSAALLGLIGLWLAAARRLRPR